MFSLGGNIYLQVRQTHGSDPGVILHWLAELDQHHIIDGQPNLIDFILRVDDDLVHSNVLHKLIQMFILSIMYNLVTWCGAAQISPSQSMVPSVNSHALAFLQFRLDRHWRMVTSS